MKVRTTRTIIPSPGTQTQTVALMYGKHSEAYPAMSNEQVRRRLHGLVCLPQRWPCIPVNLFQLQCYTHQHSGHVQIIARPSCMKCL